MSPLIRECERLKKDFFVLHTGQHFTFDMDKVFFEDLNLKRPDYFLDAVANTESRTPAHLLAKMMIGIEEVLTKERPEVVLVPSDPHSTLAGAIVAAHLHMKVGHVESGLRSYDWSMPEEINRIMTDHISTFLFAPTEDCAEKLRQEGLSPKKIFVTGNTVVDAVLQHVELARKKSNILKQQNLESGQYILATCHRAENLNDEKRLRGVFAGIEKVADLTKLKVAFPVHPSTQKALERYGLPLPACMQRLQPQGFLDFLQLQANAQLILTDSGGIQEESSVLRIPCVTLRDNTERPESVTAGSNMVAGTDPEKILACATKMLSKARDWKNPFGDGTAAQKIIEIISR